MRGDQTATGFTVLRRADSPGGGVGVSGVFGAVTTTVRFAAITDASSGAQAFFQVGQAVEGHGAVPCLLALRWFEAGSRSPPHLLLTACLVA